MQTYNPDYQTPVENDELRALLRIVTEQRGNGYRHMLWIQNLAVRVGLDLSDPEGAIARRAA